MSHLMLDEGGPGQISDEKLASLLKSVVDSGFQLDNNEALSTVKRAKRHIKRRKTPLYRRINTYSKSIKQYKMERERRQKILHLRMIEFRSQQQIADKLGISLSTVKRDLKKLRRYVVGQNNRAIQLMRAERHQIYEQATEGLSLRERFDYLSLEIERFRKMAPRGYKGHYSIFFIDLTQIDKYGIPKCTLYPRQTTNAQLAYPHRVRVRIKGTYEGRTFETDIAGFVINQITKGWF